jgi:hypothetical protein
MNYQAKPLYAELSRLLQAVKNCKASNNAEWEQKHSETIKRLCAQHLPSGAGFDSGSVLNVSLSTPEKLIFTADFHHMNENGFYDGWTEHTVTVLPSLSSGITLRISGRNRNEIKEHIWEVFEHALKTDVTYDLLGEQFPEFRVTSKWENEDGTPSQCYQAFYVGENRFWNDFQGAREFATQQMHAKFYGKGGN